MLRTAHSPGVSRAGSTTWIRSEDPVPFRVAQFFALAIALIVGSGNCAWAQEPVAAAETEIHESAGGHAAIGVELPLWTVIPFVTLLLCIAILPLAAEHWWHSNANKGIVAGVLAAITTIYVVSVFHQPGVMAVVHVLTEYVSFILLLGALYVISGGIYVKGSLSGTPLANTGLLALGAVIASFIGTTGASVLLIRPLLAGEPDRGEAKAHIVIFFIFIVSNCGGLLTPLGDPPLFLGFLNGVPFFWTLDTCGAQWLLVNVALLAIFNIWDQTRLRSRRTGAARLAARRGAEARAARRQRPAQLRVPGGRSSRRFIARASSTGPSGCAGGDHGRCWPLSAYFTTPAANRAANSFTFGPIIEVAVLFIGIFITMAPALQILNAWGQRRPHGARASDSAIGPAVAVLLGHRHPVELSRQRPDVSDAGRDRRRACRHRCRPGRTDSIWLKFLQQRTRKTAALLAAISCGAVFMGANTYIGNGPNFMVKAIAEENGVNMPSFFGYMAYSGMILIPLFVVVTVVFFWG